MGWLVCWVGYCTLPGGKVDYVDYALLIIVNGMYDRVLLFSIEYPTYSVYFCEVRRTSQVGIVTYRSGPRAIQWRIDSPANQRVADCHPTGLNYLIWLVPLLTFGLFDRPYLSSSSPSL